MLTNEARAEVQGGWSTTSTMRESAPGQFAGTAHLSEKPQLWCFLVAVRWLFQSSGLPRRGTSGDHVCEHGEREHGGAAAQQPPGQHGPGKHGPHTVARLSGKRLR